VEGSLGGKSFRGKITETFIRAVFELQDLQGPRL
jgi:hypothetical protein